MSLTILLAILAIIAVGWHVTAGIMIFIELQRRGEKVNFILIRFMLPIYINRYKKITFSETGKVGRLFYHWIISINTALVLVVAALIYKFG
jgi:hypothetical protein